MSESKTTSVDIKPVVEKNSSPTRKNEVQNSTATTTKCPPDTSKCPPDTSKCPPDTSKGQSSDSAATTAKTASSPNTRNKNQQQRRRGSSKSTSVSGPGGSSIPPPFYHRHYYPHYNQQNQYPYQQQTVQQGQQTRRHHSDGAGKKFRRHSATINAATAAKVSESKNAKTVAERRVASRSESGQNGENDFYPDDDFELEEPFSESDEDDDDKVLTTKMKRTVLSLPMPRRRIRTLSGMIPAVGYSPVWGGPTMCLACFEFFDLSTRTDQYVLHLLEKHRIIVTDIELIVDLKRYIEYWRHRFGAESIEKIFPEIEPGESDPLHGKVEKYFLMSEKLPEDRQIRERLAMRRLEEVLSCQQREREDRLFARQCLFCRYQAKGNRSKLIHHLYMIHHLNLGSPDNLVFVNEYLDVLQGKLQRGECIYCEKQFPDHPTLMEHMRKKGHREVNPNNNYYDKFYVINYLELGKKWVEVLAEDFEDTMPTFVDSEEEEEEEAWNEWQEDNIEEEEMTIVCLFCDESFVEADKLLDHMNDGHQFDLRKIVKDDKMNFYDRVKFINFIRKLSHNCICFVCGKDDLHSWQALRKHLSEGDHLHKLTHHREKWDKEEFLIPTYENDSFLCVLDEFDDDPCTLADPAIVDNGPVDSSPDSVIFAEDPPDLTDTVLNDAELREQLK